MKFAPEKSPLYALLIFSIVSVVLTLQLKTLIYEPEAGIILPLLLTLPVGLLLWIWFGTYYEVSNGKLTYRNGPFSGGIEINTIREIRKAGAFSFVGMKPALSMNGIIIAYNQFDEIYIAPNNKRKFIDELLRWNPGIILKLQTKTNNQP
jgi:hypothetical protein